jgi:hypothetical protein
LNSRKSEILKVIPTPNCIGEVEKQTGATPLPELVKIEPLGIARQEPVIKQKNLFSYST